MKLFIIIGLCILLVGCNNELLISKCSEARSVTLKAINQIDELNNNYGYNLSYETDIKTYNKLCGKYTRELQLVEEVGR